jgi:hypothetical protein
VDAPRCEFYSKPKGGGARKGKKAAPVDLFQVQPLGESVIKCPSPLNALKATHGRSWYWARSDYYQHLMTDPPRAIPGDALRRRRRVLRRGLPREVQRCEERWRRLY